jgi:hypothetical protein
MARVIPISEHLERQSLVLMEATIPSDMTIRDWRKQGRPRHEHPAECDHLHESTTRYDHTRKQLSFLLVCPVCHTEKLVETVPYEPRFEPSQPEEPAGATVYQFPVRRHEQPMRRAA